MAWARPSRTPEFNIAGHVLGARGKRGPVYINPAPPHLSATLIHGGSGGSYGMPCCAHRWVVLQGVGGEVVQDFVCQPTEAMRMQTVTYGEVLAEIGREQFPFPGKEAM